MFEPLRCSECKWTTKPKHKRPTSALGLHRAAAHRPQPYDALVDPAGSGTHTTIQAAVDALPDGGTIAVAEGTYSEQVDLGDKPPGYFIIFLNGEQRFVPAEEHQQTMDRHWFFRGGALKESFKRDAVREVVRV